MSISRVISGVRPTGNIHLGNYLGALKRWGQWTKKSDEQLFCVVDLHSLTTRTDVQDLAENTRIVAASYIACGLDPKKSIIFLQSSVPALTELSWYLGCLTPLGWLNRMTQFKDKSVQKGAFLGLYAYPVLMASDVLLYKATHVPVGEDQKQHVEFVRDIAVTFNRTYDRDVFPLPEPVIPEMAARIMSLREGNKKMGKSDPSDYSRINLMDDPDTVRSKIRKAKTDTDPLPDTTQALSSRPEARNLLTIYAELCDLSLEEACHHFSGHSFSFVKTSLTDVVIAHLAPIREKIKMLLQDREALDRLLKEGAEKAQIIAASTLHEVRSVIGLLNL